MKKVILILLCFVSTFRVISQEVDENHNFIQRYFYRDKVIAIEKFYGDDKKLDSLKTYYPSGEIDEDFHYTKERYDGLSFKYNKKGEKLTTWKFENGKLIERTDHKIEFNKKTEEKVKSYHEKLKETNIAIKENPNSTKLRFQRARIRHYLGNYTLALNDFKKIEKKMLQIQEKKELPEKLVGSVFDHLAGIYSYYEMENHTIHYKVKAIIASPKESRLYYNLGNYLVKNKYYRLGTTYLNKAIEMVPDHSFANWGLSAAYTDLADYEKAMTCVNIAFKNEATLYKRGIVDAERDLRTIRGFLYHKLGESDKGITDLEEALNINSDNAFALRNLGVIYHDLANYNKSCELLNKAKALGYEKTHDRYDLQDYLEYSCNNKMIEHKSIKLVDQPFVYPNPVIDVLSIHNFEFENYNYRIFSFESELMLQGKAENKRINISNLSSGLYILEIEANGVINSFKIVKE